MAHADNMKLMNILTLNKMTNSKAMDVKSLTNLSRATEPGIIACALLASLHVQEYMDTTTVHCISNNR